MAERLTIQDAFELLYERYGLTPREKQPLLSLFYAAPLYYYRGFEPDENEDVEERTTAVVEGGTGIGKTLAYMLPAVLVMRDRLERAFIPNDPALIPRMFDKDMVKENVDHVMETGKPLGEMRDPKQPHRIVFVTSSKVLQEQILSKDLPIMQNFLRSIGERPLRVVKVEGMGNFLCHESIEKFLDADLASKTTIQFEDTANLIRLAQALVESGAQTLEKAKDVAGEDPKLRAGLRILEDENIFSPGDGCSHCTRECLYRDMVRDLDLADVVIANHHWIASKTILPEMRIHKKRDEGEELDKDDYRKLQGMPVRLGRDFIIFDEAHQFEEAVLSCMTTTIYTRSLGEKAAEFGQILADWAKTEASSDEEGSPVYSLPELVKRFGDLMAEAGARILDAVDNIERRMESGDDDAGKSPEVWLEAKDVLDQLWQIKEEIDEHIKHKEEREEMLYAADWSAITVWKEDKAFDLLRRRLGSLRNVLNLALDEDASKNMVFSQTPTQVSLSPLSPGPILRSWPMWNRSPKVFTSATIGVPGARKGPFAYFIRRIGIRDDRIFSVAASSPFSYKNNTFLFIPDDLVDPNDEAREEYLKEAVVKAARMTGGGSLVLFTSYKEMHRVFDAVKDRLRRDGLKVHAQGSRSIHTLRDMLREHPECVIFGVSSMWQGLDIPGENLRHIIMAKLPFLHPSDPFLEANMRNLREYLRKKDPDLDDYRLESILFKSIQVPAAILRFRQGYGRLIRDEKDKGMVTILDPRILTKRYGSRFIEALPSPDITVVRKWKTAEQMAKDMGIRHELPKRRAGRRLSAAAGM